MKEIASLSSWSFSVFRIGVKVFARLGGFKKLRNSGPTEEIRGSSVIERRVLFAVDAKPPQHCRLTRSCTDPAIYLEQDAVKV